MAGKRLSWSVIWPIVLVLLLGLAFAHMRLRVERAETLASLETAAERAVEHAQNCLSEAGARLSQTSRSETLDDLNRMSKADKQAYSMAPCESNVYLSFGNATGSGVPLNAGKQPPNLSASDWEKRFQATAGTSDVRPVIEGPYEDSSANWYVVERVPFPLAANRWMTATIPISRLFGANLLAGIIQEGVDVRISGADKSGKSSAYLRMGGSQAFSPMIQKRVAIGANYLTLELSPLKTDIFWNSAMSCGLIVAVLALVAGALGYEYRAEVNRLKAEIQKRTKTLREVKSQLDLVIRNASDLGTLAIGAAYRDALTGLPNWLYFLEHLERSLQRHSGSKDLLTVVLAELDHLSDLQKRLDSAEMEQLLTQAVGRFEQQLRPSDLAAARLGNGELAFLLFDADEGEMESEVFGKLSDVFQEPFVINEKTIILTTSFGLASSHEFRRARELVHAAETRLQAVRTRSQKKERVTPKDRYGVAKPQETDEFTDVRRAIEQNQLRLEYLPIISLQTRKIEALEVLARWHHPFKGIISPSRFVPLAEAAGQAEFLTRWVLNESARQFSAWRRNVAGIDQVAISINMSPHEFSRAGLYSSMEAILAEHSIPANRVYLELDEEILSGDVTIATQLARRLQELGVRLSFEEFGGGFSALSSLRLINWDCVKIAKKFGMALTASIDQQQWLRALTHMAQDLHIECIAKAIETELAAEQFAELGYKLGQGFLFYRPLEAAKVEAILRKESGGAV